MITPRSGDRVHVRPIRPDDKQKLLDAFERLSPKSRYRRFFSATPKLRAGQVRYLTEVDHHTHEALVAIDPRSNEGPRRLPVHPLARRPGGRGNRRRGRRRLTWARPRDRAPNGLTDRAREEGVERFSAMVLAENEPMLDLLRRLGDVEVTGRDHGAKRL